MGTVEFEGVPDPAAVQVDYEGPKEQTYYLTVTAIKGRKFEPVGTCSDGIVVRHKGEREVASVARWPAVMLGIRWALERSAQLRADLRVMLDAFEKPANTVAVPVWLVDLVIKVAKRSSCTCSENRDENGQFVGHAWDRECPKFLLKHLQEAKKASK